MKRSTKVALSFMIIMIILVNQIVPVSAEDYLNWKQTDSRWATIHLGASSNTMASAGCLVTSIAIAMYDLGYTENGTFNPGVLVNKLNSVNGFTNYGALYWAALANAISGASTTKYVGNSVDTIRNNLAGKNRVVINVDNGGHWVYVQSVSSDGTKLTVSQVSDVQKNVYALSEVVNFAVVHYEYSVSSKPTNPWISVNKFHFSTGENITLNCGATGATNYYLGIDKNGTRVDTPSLGGNTSYVRSFNEPGNYSAYVTSTNSAGGIDSTRVYFTVGNDYVPEKTVSSNGKIYSIYRDNLTWNQAKLVCEQMGGHLATITSAQEQDIVKTLVSSGGCPSYWLGGTDEGRAVNDFAWITGEPFSYSNWRSGQPDNCQIENFIQLFNDSNLNFGWNDNNDTAWSYSTNIGFICEVDAVLSPVAVKYYNNHKYLLYDHDMSWLNAKVYCESQHGYLTSITTSGEQSAVNVLVDLGKLDYYFLGASDQAAEGTWRWNTSETWSYTNWGTSQPDNYLHAEDFLHLYKSTKSWNDVLNWSSLSFGFICEQNPCTITFNAMGGTSVSGKSCFPNGKITAPAAPTRSGYIFVGWYKDSTCKTAWNFSTNAVASNMTLYARWLKTPTTGLSAASAGYNSIKLTWAAVSGADGYTIYRSTSLNGAYTAIASTTSINYTNSGLSTGSTYYFKVRAYSIYNASKVYNGLSSTVSAKPLPGKPASVKAATSGYSSVKLTWDAVSGATGYQIYRATSSTGTYSLISTITSGSTVSFSNTGLTTGKTYYYKVRAYRTVGSNRYYGSLTAAVSAKPLPTVPSSFKAASTGYSSVKLTWGAVSGATGYQIYRATSSTGTYSLISTITSSSTVSFNNTGLTTGKAYYYKIRAFRTVNGIKYYGNYTSAASAVPVPSTPANFKTTASGSSYINLSWSAVSGATGYKVYRSSSASGTFDLLATTAATSFSNSGLIANTGYYYKVRAYRLAGTTNIYGSATAALSCKTAALVVANGNYHVISKENASQYLNGYSDASLEYPWQIITAPNDSSPEQIFTFNRQTDGSYLITVMGYGRLLTVNGSATAGTKLISTPASGSASQLFCLTRKSGDGYTISPIGNPDLVLTRVSTKTYSNVEHYFVQLEIYTGAANQFWQLSATS